MTSGQKNKIMLNCDMGEGIGNEELIMPWIDAANIACGYHAGDAAIMWQTVELAVKHNVLIGAHPSFPDKQNFGRKEMYMSPEDIYDIVTQQLIILNEIISSFDTVMNHVKPHGALYNMSAKDPLVAKSIVDAVKDFHPSLVLFGLSGSVSIREAEKAGLKTANEVFADRTYQDDGSLTPRTHKEALIDDVNEVLEQALRFANKEGVISVSGKTIDMKADTICIHGDGTNALVFAQAIYKALN